MALYQAILIEEADSQFSRKIIERNTEELPEGELLIKVHYSALNQKDAMCAHGNRGVTKNFPHQPGIDAAGVIEQSSSSEFSAGDEVIVTGYDLGMNTPGGLGEYIRVPAKWVIRRPDGMTLKQAMQFGTAGLTAALCIDKLERAGLEPGQGPVLVTGATGGVGSIAIVLLSNAGYQVVASSGKPEQEDFLLGLGAEKIIDRSILSEENRRPLLGSQYAGAIDVVGGHTLANTLKSMLPGSSVACCGLVQSINVNVNLIPFIILGVNLLGVDSVEIPLSKKQAMWQRLAKVAALPGIEKLNAEISLSEVPEQLEHLYAAGMVGHTVVKVP